MLEDYHKNGIIRQIDSHMSVLSIEKRINIYGVEDIDVFIDGDSDIYDIKVIDDKSMKSQILR